MVLNVLKGLREDDRDDVVHVGDMNVNQEEDYNAMGGAWELTDGYYCGATWGGSENRFYAELVYKGRGLRKDCVLFGKWEWAHVYRIGLAAG